MLGERRSRFRFTVSLSVLLTPVTSGTAIECSTLNVSSNGMAVVTPIGFKLAETLDTALFLPNGFRAEATGIVIWDDKHGKSGLNFQCKTPEMRHKLDSWLDSMFATSGQGKSNGVKPLA